MSHTRWLAVAVAASLALLSAVQPSIAHADPPPFSQTMPDAAYRACVTAKLGIASDAEPTSEQLASITELSCTGRSIADAAGTSALPNLTKLFLDSNAITDVRPLAGSTKVFSLGLAGNAIEDVSALSSLTKLRSVNLAGNRLSDISVLGTLPEYDSTSGTRYGQKAVGTATAQVAAIVPVVLGAKGNVVTPTAPSGVTVSGTTVTYPSAGAYTWTFRDETDFYFNGSVTVSVAEPSTITIPDDGLRGCVNSRLGIAADVQPTVAQLAGLTGALTCKSKGVANLTGANLLTGITSMTLTGNSIRDLAPLSALTNLTLLDVGQNEVTSLASLGSLPKLATVRVGQTAVSTKTRLASLAGVDKLTGLTALTINYTSVTSLSPLAGHPALKTLEATSVPVSDVTPLASAALLTSINLTGDRVADLSPLKGKTYATLKVLDQVLTAPPATATKATAAPSVVLQDGTTLVATPPPGVAVSSGSVTYAAEGSYSWTFTNAASPFPATFSGTIAQTVDPAPPVVVGVEIPDAGFRGCLAGILGQDAAAPITAEQLGSLTSVSCVGKGITDLSGAQHLTGVLDLTLSTNAISDLAPLKDLPKVTSLLLPGNAVSDPSPLAGLTSLTTLNLSYNPITSIASLAPLSNLTDFEITQRSTHANPDLTSLDGVASMTKLTRLVANNSSLTDLTPVAGLTGLTRLFVSSNRIADLGPLRNLTGLTQLGLGSNRISDVTPLAALTKLESLDLASNQIGDLSPLDLPNLGYMGLKARWQTVAVPSVPAKMEVSVPQPRDHFGIPATLTAPAGITPADGRVTYPEAGAYSWSFSASGDTGEFFSGTIVQDVTAPVPHAANIPDTNLRACLATAAGLAAGTVPTDADLAAVTAADCSARGISDLTGAELLTGATSLTLAGNPVASVAPLSGLTGLKELDLARTGLSDVTPLSGLTGLTRLVLDGNHLRDLAPLQRLTIADLSAVDQTAALSDAAGGTTVPIPTVTTAGDEVVAATSPAGATAVTGGVSFRLAGTYAWPFRAADGRFTGTLTQRITSDVVDESVHAAASACIAANHVWVVVERDTGLQQGGCATKFSTGLEALVSAGFTVTGTDFVTTIDQYPKGDSGASYWSYWHGTNPQEVPALDRAKTSTKTLSYTWELSQVGAGQYAPRPGTIEGWRFQPYVEGSDAVPPTWAPIVTLDAPDPDPGTPTSPGTTVTPSTPAPTGTSTPSGGATSAPGHDPGLANTGGPGAGAIVLALVALVGSGVLLRRR